MKAYEQDLKTLGDSTSYSYSDLKFPIVNKRARTTKRVKQGTYGLAFKYGKEVGELEIHFL